jgi:hypothetical protein
LLIGDLPSVKLACVVLFLFSRNFFNLYVLLHFHHFHHFHHHPKKQGLLDGSKLGLLAADDSLYGGGQGGDGGGGYGSTLALLEYDKTGKKTLRRVADFNLGATVGGAVTASLASPHSSSSSISKGSSGSDVDGSKRKRVGVFVATLEGGAGCVLPVDEVDFRRLYALQLVLGHALRHHAALNPRQYRRCRRPCAAADIGVGLVARRNVLDGQLLWRFASELDVRDQHRLASAVGTSAAKVLESLRAVDASLAGHLSPPS